MMHRRPSPHANLHRWTAGDDEGGAGQGAGAGCWSTYGDLDAVVGEDQGRVGGSELRARHCE